MLLYSGRRGSSLVLRSVRGVGEDPESENLSLGKELWLTSTSVEFSNNYLTEAFLLLFLMSLCPNASRTVTAFTLVTSKPRGTLRGRNLNFPRKKISLEFF